MLSPYYSKQPSRGKKEGNARVLVPRSLETYTLARLSGLEGVDSNDDTAKREVASTPI